jgi:hypothetical protein
MVPRNTATWCATYSAGNASEADQITTFPLIKQKNTQTIEYDCVAELFE